MRLRGRTRSPPIHANNFTPMNCSQLMAGAIFRTGVGAGSDGADVTGIGGGARMGFGVRTGLGAGVTGEAAIFTGGAGAGATGDADSRSRFNWEIPDPTSPMRKSSSRMRRESSSMRLRALTARTINQTARARKAPKTVKTTKTTIGIISSINFAFRPTIRLGCVQCALRREHVASCNDTASNHLLGSFSLH